MSAIEKVSTSELQREMVRRRRGVEALVRRRERLVRDLRDVEARIREAGVAVGGRRPSNKTNLADALAALLARSTMSVTEMADAVQRAGYRTTSPNFRTIVNQTLLKDKRFRRVSRGRYTAGKRVAS